MATRPRDGVTRAAEARRKQRVSGLASAPPSQSDDFQPTSNQPQLPREQQHDFQFQRPRQVHQEPRQISTRGQDELDSTIQQQFPNILSAMSTPPRQVGETLGSTEANISMRMATPPTAVSQRHHLQPPPSMPRPNYPEHHRDQASLLERSEAAGDEVATLLASVRKRTSIPATHVEIRSTFDASRELVPERTLTPSRTRYSTQEEEVRAAMDSSRELRWSSPSNSALEANRSDFQGTTQQPPTQAKPSLSSITSENWTGPFNVQSTSQKNLPPVGVAPGPSATLTSSSSSRSVQHQPNVATAPIQPSSVTTATTRDQPPLQPLQQNPTLKERHPHENNGQQPPDDSDGEDEDGQDEELTLEDIEETLCHPQSDAACLFHLAMVQLRAYATCRTVRCALHAADLNPAPYDNDWHGHDAEVTGLGLAEKEEVLLLIIDRDPALKDRPFLCYGDQVSLHSTAYGKSLALGIRVAKGPQHHLAQPFQIGFYPYNERTASSSMLQKWTVIRAPTNAKSGVAVVRIGPSSLQSRPQQIGRTAPVKSGDAILLRNCLTGGVLSIHMPTHTEPGRLRLLTDSYDSSRVRHGQNDDPSLVRRLHRHNKLEPSSFEIFQLLQIHVPPLPHWVGEKNNRVHERPYLDHSYHHRAEQGTLSGAKLQHSDGLCAELFQQWKNCDVDEIRRKQQQDTHGQDLVLIDELLGSFLGLEGTFITFHTMKGVENGGSYVLRVDSPPGRITFDPVNRSLVEELLPLATSYVRVRRFASNHFPGFEHGTVMQALCREVDRYLQIYSTFIVELDALFRKDNHRLSLQWLHLKVSEHSHVMRILDQVIHEVQDFKGGALIRGLLSFKNMMLEGDPIAGKVIVDLLEAAAAPYFLMLTEWLQRGDLNDPHDEFMIKYCESDSWEEQYQVVPEHDVLQGRTLEHVHDLAVSTGRYWNAIKTCLGEDFEHSVRANRRENCTNITIASTTCELAGFIEKMNAEASELLMRILFDDFNVIGSLRLIKRYFLLDHGDFVVKFLDFAEDELAKKTGELSRGRIQHWLNVAVQSSENGGEPKFEPAGLLSPQDLRCAFVSESLADFLDRLHEASGGIDTHEAWTPLRHAYGGLKSDDLTGLDVFLLDFVTIPFPVRLVLGQSVMAKYQLLFRHLFFAKHVERRLVGIWQDHQALKELQALRGVMGATFLLRQRMLHFIQNLLYYFLFEVIEPSWLQMEAVVSSSKGSREHSADDILKVHTLFVERTLESCLLTNRNLIRALTKLMKTCLLFADQMKRFMKATRVEEDRRIVAVAMHKELQRNRQEKDGSDSARECRPLQEVMKAARTERQRRIQLQTLRVEREVGGESYRRMLSRFEEVFSENLRDFMGPLSQCDDLFHSQKVNLCIRLDYNGFVAGSLALNHS